MNQKKITAALAVGFVVLLGGASLLYQRLGSQVEREVIETSAAETAAAETAPAENAAAETAAAETSAAETGAAEKTLAPDFTVLDGDGNEVRLSDFTGKPVILNFWASWCPPCKSEMPDFDAAYEQYGGEIQFMMINLTDGSRETVETAKAYIEEQGYGFPVYYDTIPDAAITYGIMSVPATFFIDAERVPVARATGAIDGETLEKGIGMILE